MEDLINESDRMGELLGDDHDMALMRQMLTDEPGKFGNTSDVEVLLALMDRRRTELEQEARLLGRRCYLDKPREFARRLKGYWQTWHDQANSKPPE
jgi:hypothetical protein